MLPPLLLHNIAAEPGKLNHWLMLGLQGTHSNRDGYGARVKVTQGGPEKLREVR